MNDNQMRLRDAGFREKDFALRVIVPQFKGLSFDDILDHAVYDASADTVSVKGLTFKVTL